MRRVAATALVATLAVAMAGAAEARAVTPLPPTDPRTLETATPALGSFYEPPAGARRGRPGGLVRVRRARGLGVRAWRILYRSRDLANRTTVVSGIVLVPPGRAPRGGFPVIAFAHGTTGVSRRCGVSQAPAVPNTPGYSTLRRFWAHMLNAGFAVVASDYQGMGGPGPAAYVVGEINARNVLDAVRAARALPRRARGIPALGLRRVVTYGNSEGGQTSAFVGEIAPRYAPDLRVAGTAVSAPANPPSSPAQSAYLLSFPPSPLSGYATMIFFSWDRVYRSRGFRATQVLTPDALSLFGVLGTRCADAAAAAFTRPPREYLRPIGPRYGTYYRLAAENQPGRRRAHAPILLLQGLKDPIVQPSSTAQVLRRMCARGDRVAYRTYPDADHTGVVAPSMPDVLAWARARLAGSVAPSSCSGAPPS